MPDHARLIETLRKIQQLERGEIVFINRQDAEDCENRGWAQAQPGAGWRLTEAGRAELNSN